MPRPPRDWQATHAAADAREPKLAAAIVAAMAKLRGGLDIAALRAGLERAAKATAGRSAAERRILATALGRKLALAVLPASAVADALAPAARIKGEAVLKGGRLGAAQVREAR